MPIMGKLNSVRQKLAELPLCTNWKYFIVVSMVVAGSCFGPGAWLTVAYLVKRMVVRQTIRLLLLNGLCCFICSAGDRPADQGTALSH